jgi:hypothetical protein
LDCCSPSWSATARATGDCSLRPASIAEAESAIAHQLRTEHPPAPSTGWGHPAVHRVLTNPTYLGRIRWRDQDVLSTHEPLIEQSTFDQARAILTERGNPRNVPDVRSIETRGQRRLTWRSRVR